MPPCLDLMCQQIHRKHMCRYLKIYCVRVTGFYLNQSTNIVKNLLNTTIKSKSRLNIYSLIIVCTVLLPSGLLKYVSLFSFRHLWQIRVIKLCLHFLYFFILVFSFSGRNAELCQTTEIRWLSCCLDTRLLFHEWPQTGQHQRLRGTLTTTSKITCREFSTDCKSSFILFYLCAHTSILLAVVLITEYIS